METLSTARLADQDQMDNMVGSAGLEIARASADTDWYRAYKEVDPDGPDPEEGAFRSLQQIANGIQGAGPNLTPETFWQGLAKIPHRTPNPVWSIGGGYGPDEWLWRRRLHVHGLHRHHLVGPQRHRPQLDVEGGLAVDLQGPTLEDGRSADRSAALVGPHPGLHLSPSRRAGLIASAANQVGGVEGAVALRQAVEVVAERGPGIEDVRRCARRGCRRPRPACTRRPQRGRRSFRWSTSTFRHRSPADSKRSDTLVSVTPDSVAEREAVVVGDEVLRLSDGVVATDRPAHHEPVTNSATATREDSPRAGPHLHPRGAGHGLTHVAAVVVHVDDNLGRGRRDRAIPFAGSRPDGAKRRSTVTMSWIRGRWRCSKRNRARRS